MNYSIFLVEGKPMLLTHHAHTGSAGLAVSPRPWEAGSRTPCLTGAGPDPPAADPRLSLGSWLKAWKRCMEGRMVKNSALQVLL